MQFFLSNYFMIMTIAGLLCYGRLIWAFYTEIKKSQDPYELYQQNWLAGAYLYGVIGTISLGTVMALKGLWVPMGLLVFCFFTLMIGTDIWLKSVRKTRRICVQCSLPMKRIENPQQETAYLDVRQRWEEHLKAIDYDVWICPNGHYRSDMYNGKKFMKYRMCPACGTQALEIIKTETDTHYDNYRAHMTLKCLACAHSYQAYGDAVMYRVRFRKSEVPQKKIE